MFARADLWAPLAREAFRESGLTPPERLEAAQPGTHAVLRADGVLAVKFYAPFWPDDWGKDVELYTCLGQWPELQTPQLVASGCLPAGVPGAGGVSWPYTISTWRPGRPIGAVWAALGGHERRALAGQLGRMLARLHTLPLTGLRAVPAEPEDWAGFLRKQAQGAASRHVEWGSLPAHLAAELPGYLQHPRALPTEGWRPCLLNGDVTADHVLVIGQGGRPNGPPEISGLIDFGDAMAGEPVYEFPVVLISALGCDSDAASAFFAEYECTYACCRRPPAAVPPPPERLLAYALMHRFNILEGIRLWRPQVLSAARTLDELARMIWGDAAGHG